MHTSTFQRPCKCRSAILDTKLSQKVTTGIRSTSSLKAALTSSKLKWCPSTLLKYWTPQRLTREIRLGSGRTITLYAITSTWSFGRAWDRSSPQRRPGTFWVLKTFTQMLMYKLLPNLCRGARIVKIHYGNLSCSTRPVGPSISILRKYHVSLSTSL